MAEEIIEEPKHERQPQEGYIDKHECARMLGRTVRSVDTYMAAGIIPYYKLGRTVVFKWSEVDAHIRHKHRVFLRS